MHSLYMSLYVTPTRLVRIIQYLYSTPVMYSRLGNLILESGKFGTLKLLTNLVLRESYLLVEVVAEWIFHLSVVERIDDHLRDDVRQGDNQKRQEEEDESVYECVECEGEQEH